MDEISYKCILIHLDCPKYIMKLKCIFDPMPAAFIQFLPINEPRRIADKTWQIKQIYGTINLKFKTKMYLLVREYTAH